MTDNGSKERRAPSLSVSGGRSSALLVYTLSHAAVDLACGYILYAMYSAGSIGIGNTVGLFLLYNTLAFGLQFIFGAVCDRFGGCRFIAALGCLLTALGVIVGGNSPIIAATLAGIGNAAFHSGGGTDTLRHTDGMTGSGIFVSSGAIGLALGMRLGAGGKLPSHAVVIMMFFAAAAIMLYCGEKYADGSAVPVRCMPPIDFDNTKKSLLPFIHGACTAVFICLFAIVIRSYTGFAAPSPGFEGKFAFLYVAVCAFGGKLIGGVLADLIGARRVGVAALALSAPLFWLGAGRGIFFLAAVFFFNIAMPITLCTVARRLPGHEGFAFGLNTLALLVGYLFSMVKLPSAAAKILAVALTLIAAAAVLLTVSDERPSSVSAMGAADAAKSDSDKAE